MSTDDFEKTIAAAVPPLRPELRGRVLAAAEAAWHPRRLTIPRLLMAAGILCALDVGAKYWVQSKTESQTTYNALVAKSDGESSLVTIDPTALAVRQRLVHELMEEQP
jgi:hypothetical protein